MTENNETPNDFVQTPEEETAPQAKVESHNQQGGVTAAEVNGEQSNVQEAVQAALAKAGVKEVLIQPCICGETKDLSIKVAQNSAVGRVTCAGCGIWGVDFLVPAVNDQDIVGRAATKAWNEAPRAI